MKNNYVKKNYVESPFYSKIWKMGVENTSEIKITKIRPLDRLYTITNGLHSYSCDKTCISTDGTKMKVYRNFGNYKHLLNTILLDYTDLVSVVKVKCTIPKGSTYYENDMGEIVSNKLIPNEIIDEFKFLQF